MRSYKIAAACELEKQRQRLQRDHKPWHFENPDCSPLCHRPQPATVWEHDLHPNPKELLTTENVKYVTCKRCLAILKMRGGKQ